MWCAKRHHRINIHAHAMLPHCGIVHIVSTHKTPTQRPTDTVWCIGALDVATSHHGNVHNTKCQGDIMRRLFSTGGRANRHAHKHLKRTTHTKSTYCLDGVVLNQQNRVCFMWFRPACLFVVVVFRLMTMCVRKWRSAAWYRDVRVWLW